MTTDQISVIARLCHEANRALCQAFRQEVQPQWDSAPDWQREASIQGVHFVLNNPTLTPTDFHEAWRAEKTRDGWRYGLAKDPVAKTHPCLVPFVELPDVERAKDFVLVAIIEASVAIIAHRETQRIVQEALASGENQD